ncbi:hypothetical protein OVA14_08640 [Agrococcus sp. SL85]|nr:hypothetical protein [Agrococcus sp. SL85]WAC65435.1 hypothetical protein OVA14_08640 [Agrococcus sp. SL85]
MAWERSASRRRSPRRSLRPQPGAPWAGLGVLLGGAPERPRAVSLGWGEGFQCMLRAVPHEGRAVVVMTNADPGVPQEASITGRVVALLEAEARSPEA